MERLENTSFFIEASWS